MLFTIGYAVHGVVPLRFVKWCHIKLVDIARSLGHVIDTPFGRMMPGMKVYLLPGAFLEVVDGKVIQRLEQFTTTNSP